MGNSALTLALSRRERGIIIKALNTKGYLT